MVSPRPTSLVLCIPGPDDHHLHVCRRIDDGMTVIEFMSPRLGQLAVLTFTVEESMSLSRAVERTARDALARNQ